MRLTSSCTLTLALLLSACGGGGGNTTDDTGTTPATPGTTEPATTGTGTASSTSNDPTTEPTGTTVEPATSSSTTTGDPLTGSTSVTSDPSTGPVTATTGDTTGEPGTTTGASSSTGEPMSGGACMSDADCTLHNDCCDCYAVPVGQDDPICKKECKQSTCDMLGIDKAVCRFGTCATEKVNCDASKVACDEAPPDCPPGQFAHVVGVCWSGSCVDALSCDVVPDCGACPDGTMCVLKQAQLPTLPTCEPIPVECDGAIDCKCAGSFVCTKPFDACSSPGGNEIDCSCPSC